MLQNIITLYVICNLSKEIGNRYHICHISTKETVAGLREYRKQGLPVSGEACPHHLILTDENIKKLKSKL